MPILPPCFRYRQKQGYEQKLIFIPEVFYKFSNRMDSYYMGQCQSTSKSAMANAADNLQQCTYRQSEYAFHSNSNYHPKVVPTPPAPPAKTEIEIPPSSANKPKFNLLRYIQRF